MDLGGILAGAMAGGGKAIQLNAQNQLEQQRQEALARLERDFARENLDYEYGLKSEAAAAQAQADEAAAVRDARLDIATDAAKLANEQRITGGSVSFDDSYERAIKRADNEYEGLVEIASNPMNQATGDIERPSYNQIAANSLRAEARSVRDPAVASQLMRQADQLDGGSSPSITDESGGAGSGNGWLNPDSMNFNFN